MSKQSINTIIKELKEEDISPNRRVDLMVNLCIYYFENNDYNEGVKYIAMASVCTQSPRADVCCLLGQYYMLMNNLKWAKFWTENAINDSYSIDLVKEEWYTWKPLYQMIQIEIMCGDLKSAKKYLDLVKTYKTNNELIELEKTIDDLSKINYFS